jgi:hypothetical protein
MIYIFITSGLVLTAVLAALGYIKAAGVTGMFTFFMIAANTIATWIKLYTKTKKEDQDLNAARSSYQKQDEEKPQNP